MKLKCLLIFIGLFWSTHSLTAQPPTGKVGSWEMLFTTFRFHQKWSIHAEAQFRDYGFVDEAEQLLLRKGITYHIDPQNAATLGYANITNYTFNGDFMEQPTVTEHRIWQQLLMRNNLGRVSIENRYRLEQRFLKVAGEDQYRNRIRYLLRASVPLNSAQIVKNSFFLTFYNEVFLNLHSDTFDRNRIYGAVGYQLSESSNVQLGYMGQTVNNLTRQFLQIGYSHSFDLRKPTIQ